MKVTCIKSVTITSLGGQFEEGMQYDIPAKDATAYAEYFKKDSTKKKATTEANKEASTEENK